MILGTPGPGTSLEGVWSLIGSLDVFHTLCLRAPDFIVVDWEHGSWDTSDTDIAVRLAASMGIATVVRCSGPDTYQIQRAVDTGADAIQVAGLHDAESLDQLVASFAPPPSGRRGFSPWTFRSLAGDQTYPEHPLLIAQAESAVVADLLLRSTSQRWPAIRGVFVGRYDLSVSLGCPASIDDPRVLDVLRSFTADWRESARWIGTVAVDGADAKRMAALGSQMTSVSSDRMLLSRGQV